MQKKRVLILISCLVLIAVSRIVTITSAMGPAQTDTVYKTPEDAITAYFGGVTQSDIGKIEQACAINEMSEKFRFDLYTARLQSLQPYAAPAPSDYPLDVEINKAQLTQRILAQLKMFTYSLLSSENVGDNTTIIIDAARTTQFIKDVDPKKLAQIEVKTIDLPNKPRMNSAQYVKNESAIAQVYGADESTERVVLFTFEQNYYVAGFSLLRYGESWKISSLDSPMAGSTSLGTAGKTTVQDFEAMVNGK